MTLIETDADSDVKLSNDNGDHERFSHIVGVIPGKKAADIILEARIEGFPVKALCGKAWVPQRDPKKFPVCPDCIKVYEQGTGRKWENR